MLTRKLLSGFTSGAFLLAASPASAQLPKRGLAANDDVPIHEFNGENCQVSWQYNWDSTTTQKLSWTEFVPMLWGLSPEHTDQWAGNAWHWINEGGSSHVLGFNEPEQSGQSSLSPSDAANAYPIYMAQFSGKAAIGSPAVSNDGYTWLKDFLGYCASCRIDFLAIHYYSGYSDSVETDFEIWVNSICSLGDGRKVWVTEFAVWGSDDQVASFMKSAITFLDNNPCVYRYAYFGVADGSTSLLENGGPSLSELGSQYAYTPYGH